MPTISTRYEPADFDALHDFDELYFTRSCAHNLVCGVPALEPRSIIDAPVQAYIASGRYGYSRADGSAQYRAAIARSLESEGIHGRSFVATAGGTGAIVLSLLATVASGDEVVMLDPDYGAYEKVARLLGARPLLCEAPASVPPSMEAVDAMIGPRTKAIIFSNPSNPLGRVVGPSALDELIALAEKRDVWLIVDEAYAGFCFGASYRSVVANASSHAISVRSLSKAGGLGGWRIGFVVGSEEITQALRDIQEYTYICPSVGSQHAGAAVLPATGALCDAFAGRLDEVCQILSDGGVEYVRPQAAFFAWVRAPMASGSGFAKRCFDDGVAVVPGRLFSRHDTHVRLSFAGLREPTLRAVEAFVAVYQKVSEERQS